MDDWNSTLRFSTGRKSKTVVGWSCPVCKRKHNIEEVYNTKLECQYCDIMRLAILFEQPERSKTNYGIGDYK